MSPMKFIKAAGQNVKLECKCGRQFWYAPELKNASGKTAICPDCGIEWSRVYTTEFKKYWIAEMLLEGNTEYVAAMVSSKATSLTDFMLRYFNSASDNPRMIGLRFGQIDEARFNQLAAEIRVNNQQLVFGKLLSTIFHREPK